ncbi:MAG: polysaccharide biosynthesis C-terminal domain-containing protein [Bacteroidetes bacterium]|nr:polysaccharide biosynthesis C-terminal domain-containing protein [Bacteroidota bacterium]
MQKKFFQNLVFLITVNALIKPVWLFGIDRTVQNTVGPEDYGLYFALFNITYILQIALDLGISNFNNRNIAQNSQLITKYFSNILIIKSFLILVYAVVIIVAAITLGYQGFELKLLGLLAVNQILASAILYFRSNIAGLQLFRLDSIFSVLDRALMIVICGALLWGNVVTSPFQIEWFIYAQTASLSFSAILAFVIVLSKTKSIRIKWNFPLLLAILRQSYPFALLFLLTVIHTRIDGVMIERILGGTLGAKQAGIYAASFRILEACTQFSFLFATLLLPIFSKMLKEKLDIAPISGLSFRTLIIPAIIFCVASATYRIGIMNQLYFITGKEDEYYTIFQLLIFSFIPIAMGYIYGTLLTANGNLRYLNMIGIGGVVLNIILNLVLIKRFQAQGAALATVITQYSIMLLQIIVVHRLFLFKVPIKTVGVFLIFLVGFVVITMLLKGYFHEIGLDWKIGFTITVIVGALLSIVLKLFNVRSIFQLLKPERLNKP